MRTQKVKEWVSLDFVDSATANAATGDGIFIVTYQSINIK